MTMAKNYLKQWSLQNEGFSSCVALRICFLTHLVYRMDLAWSAVFINRQVRRTNGVVRHYLEGKVQLIYFNKKETVQ